MSYSYYDNYLSDSNNYYTEEIEKRKEVFEKICKFFQLPKYYSRMKITSFYKDDSILDYEFIEKNRILTNNEISCFFHKYLDDIDSEKNNTIKRIKIMIFLQIINLKIIRQFISSRNKLFDVLSNKFKELYNDQDKEFVLFIKQFDFTI